MNADMHAGADAADMDSDANTRAGGSRAQKGRGKRRADQRFHWNSLLGLHRRRVIPGTRATHA
jgi:hypothetical protein